jgi:hypothetical protein
LAGPAVGCGAVVCRNISQPCPSPVRRAVLVDAAGPPPHVTGNTHPRARRTRRSPANPLLESPADSGTRAPNLQRLRQAGDARQDLVRISESTTKCGDYGEESGVDAEVSKIRGESERALRTQSRFHSQYRAYARCRKRVGIGCRANASGARAVTLSSRNHGDFPAILGEKMRKSRHFCLKLRSVSS